MASKSKKDDAKEIALLEEMLFAADDEKEESEPKAGTSKASSSLIKPADADSSDDEDQRDFQSSKYNDFGRDINKKLKEKEETRKFESIRVLPTTTPSSSSPAAPSSSSSFGVFTKPSSSKAEVIKRLGAEATEPAAFCDPIFGLRIVQPLVSSSTLKERMSGRIPVGVKRARFHTERGDVTQDWAIAGVIVTKSPVKQTQKGDSFIIWSISDLKGEIKTVSVFLFKSAYKDLWKTSVGTVISILNPKVLDRKDDKVEAVLAVDNQQKVMILGQSKDLGTCRSKKNNGDPCGAIINKTDCDVCIFHMKKEYSKIKRAEFQSPGCGGGLQDLRNKVLGKSEVFYAGQSFTSMKGAKKPAKMIQQDRDRMMTLSEYFTSPYNGESSASTSAAAASPRTPTSQPVKRPGAAAMFDTNISQRKKDLEMLRKLQGTETPQMLFTPKTAEAAEPPKKDFSFTPKLMDNNLTFTLSIPVKKNELAKQRAAAILKKKPLEASDPNLVKYRGTDAGKKRLAGELVTSSGTDENDAKKAKIANSEETTRRQDYLIKMMNATSSHANLVVDKEAEVREKVFDSMEKKEEMEERMVNTMEMKVERRIFLKTFPKSNDLPF